VALPAAGDEPERAPEEPFEPSLEAEEAPAAPLTAGFRPLADLTLRLVRYYQTEIGVHSIARCPYAVSCSRYAVGQIERHGALVGLAYFLDRFFYRENASALGLYGAAVAPDGSLKLDDGAFWLDDR
jgi:putative component of membrane protein insertase Oxa1/YidC/SpoIIIJ protein YidD